MLNFEGEKDVYCLVLDCINCSTGWWLFLHLKRYCKAFRHDRDALLAARSKLDKRSDKEVFEKHQ